MELELSFNHAGIDWLVTAEVNDEWGLEQIFKVQIYDKTKRSYVTVPCDFDEFEKEMQDKLQEALEEEQTAAYEFAMDMKFEQARGS